MTHPLTPKAFGGRIEAKLIHSYKGIGNPPFLPTQGTRQRYTGSGGTRAERRKIHLTMEEEHENLLGPVSCSDRKQRSATSRFERGEFGCHGD